MKQIGLVQKTRIQKIVPEGRIIYLDRHADEDLRFVREAYGYKAEEKGWFRERDRLFVFNNALSNQNARRKLKGSPPPSMLDIPPPPLPQGPISQRLLSMEDGTVVRWIRHPSVLPGNWPIMFILPMRGSSWSAVRPINYLTTPKIHGQRLF